MIKKSLTVKSDDIENVITKFYYKGEQLCFQIIFRLESQEIILYEDFDDYVDYRQKLTELMLLKNRGEGITVEDVVVLQNFAPTSD